MHKSSIASPVIFLLTDKGLNVGGTEGRFCVLVLLVCFHTRKLPTWAETCPFMNSGVQTPGYYCTMGSKVWGTAVHLVKMQIYDFYPLPFIRVCNVFNP